jgi:predicted acylesterase/phospholipase RssA
VQAAQTVQSVQPADPPTEGMPEQGWQSDYAEETLGQELETMLSAPLPEAGPASRGQQPVSQSVLILSGGSQQGAFGAGFLREWAAPPDADQRTQPIPEQEYRLPRFRLVTGISTGALQSTFAFLNDTRTPVEEYSIESEKQLLRPLLKGKLEDKPLKAGRQLARKGTLARLQPLRERLDTLISHDIMMRVAAEAEAGRKLLVGAVEMGSGEMAVFDLTKAATIYAESYDASGRVSETDHPRAQMRQCYIEALMASSSVPMSAAPVFIDNKMYIDGGARFGVLADLTAGAYRSAAINAAEEYRKSYEQQGIAKAPEDPTPRNLFILVNATLEVPQLCRLGKCPVDENGKPQAPADDVPHSEWDFLQLAQRSVSVLINQSYRSSVFIADGQYRAQQFKPHFVKLEPDHLRHATAIDFPGAGDAPKTCWQWRQEDERIDQPMEFFPRYMRCLIKYGEKAAKGSSFKAAEPQHDRRSSPAPRVRRRWYSGALRRAAQRKSRGRMSYFASLS